MKNKVVAVIPARLGSERFPGKVLFQYRSKPLLYYVWHSLKRSREIDKVIVATDDLRIIEACDDFGAEAVKTSKHHRTGTDRIAEAVRHTGGDFIVNVQADNFGLKPALLDKVLKEMKQDRKIEFASLAFRIENDRSLFNPDLVKVIIAKDKQAFWFSRCPLPFLRNAYEKNRAGQFKYYGHIGVYFFRRKSLEQFAAWPRGVYEKAESLEQLRILENNRSVKMYITKNKVVSVDSPDDVRMLAKLYK